MLGDTAIAVNAKDERYTHLHGKKVLLPLMNREIPIITDELAQPEFGTGAVKVTPAHDPNDFEAGKRHNLPQIDVMDEHAHMNQNAGRVCGSRPLRSPQARARRLAGAGISRRRKRLRALARQMRPLRNRGRAAPLRAVVHQNPAAGAKGNRSRRERRDHDRPRELQTDLSELDEQHPRLVHLAPVVVGTSHSGLALRRCGEVIVAREAPHELSEVRRHKAGAGHRRARHLVLLRPVAVHDSGLAGEDARSGSVLSHHAAHHGLRNSFLLGRAHDHVRLPLHAGTRAGSRDQESQRLGGQERTTACPSARFTSTRWCAMPTARRCRRPRAT